MEKHYAKMDQCKGEVLELKDDYHAIDWSAPKGLLVSI
jgi:hypothetical protein